jgi:hypothetical protein
MREERDHLRHDLTALYAFIESVVGGAARRPSAAYGPAANEFFKFVNELATTCRDYIADWKVADADEFEHKRPELEEIRGHWRELHKLIKPAFDADTLQVPSAVVDGIARRFRELPDCGNTEFALFHTAEFNYMHVHTAALRNTAKAFRAVVPNAPKFPENLGLIGMPYSQGRTAFANCLVAHEMAHYRYRGTALESTLKTRVSNAFSSLPNNIDQKQRDALHKKLADPAKRDILIKQMTLWVEEIFCDLFGIMLIGPCYTYAFIEAYDLSVVLDYSGALSDEMVPGLLQFYETYPSFIFRLQQQSVLLRGLPWWAGINQNSSRSASLLKVMQGISMETHVEGNQSQGANIRVLEAVLPDIRQAIGVAFDRVDDGFAEFDQLNSTVQNYLANGVVPSTLNIRNGDKPEDTSAITASPLVLLNSGIEFYLTRIDELMGSIKDEDVNSYQRRLHWIRRVEQWVAKAIEDQSLGMEEKDGDSVEVGDPATPQA